MADETKITIIPKGLHAPEHEAGGIDEVSVAGLVGETALLAAHRILPNIHHAPTVLDYPEKLIPALIRWTIPGYAAGTLGTVVVGANIIYYIPIFVEETTTYIRIGLEVTAFVAGNIDLRIFNWVNGLPTTLILSCGTVDCGANGLKEIIINQELTRGYYFLAYRSAVAPTLRALAPDSVIKSPVSGHSATGNMAISTGVLGVAAAYADPAPAPDMIYPLDRVCLTLREN